MKTIIIGRAPDNDICIDNISISRKHLKVVIDDKVMIEDMGSVNGTFVNDKPVKSAYISPSDIVRIGTMKLDTSQFFIKQLQSKGDKTIIADKSSFSSSGKTISVGRAPDNDIVLSDPQISSHHARFYIDGTNIFLEDTNSLNGTYVNKRKITKEKVSQSDSINFGNFKFTFESFRNFFTEKPLKKDESEKVIKLKEGVNRIGRADDNDIVIKHPMISSHHAIITKTKDILEIQDTNSLNGVFVNGSKIQKSKITYNDVINLAIYPLRLSEEKVIRAYQSDGRIDLVDLSFAVNDSGKRKVIINDISLTVYPTEFVGLIGPSGSGKTTLLNLMNGYSMPTTGEVIVNSFNLHRNQNIFRGMIGFVPQDDIIHRELTVYNSLFYSAKLRLPKDTSESEIKDRVNDIIDKLDLTRAKNTLIGSPEKKGISGGQRKRVNLAQELITQPTILFLDEPTSGLDPFADRNIMRLLRNLADEGRIVILTTHHISTENFKLFDNIVLLSKGGKVAYYGPSYPDSLQYFNADDPKEIFKEVEDKADTIDFSKNYKQSDFYKEYVIKRKPVDIYKPSSPIKKSKTSSIKQLFILLIRLTRIKISDRANTLILLLQAPILAFLIGITLNISKFTDESIDYMQAIHVMRDFLNPLNVMVLTAIFFGIINASREIVAERAIYMRERKIFLKIPSYLLSKFVLYAFITFIQSFFLVVILHSMCHLKISLSLCLLVVYFISLTSMALGLLLSAMTKSPDSAVSVSIFVLIPQIIYSGAIVPLGKMTLFVKTVSYTCLSRWGLEALLIKEARNWPDIIKKIPDPNTEQTITQVLSMREYMEETNYLLSNSSFNFNLAMIAIWGLIFLTLVIILLKLRDRIK